MPSSCVMKGCRNYDKKFKKEHGVTYHRFPVDPTRREIWCRILRKQRQEAYFKPALNTRICSAHFGLEDFTISERGQRRLKDTAVPRCQIEIEIPGNGCASPCPESQKVQTDFPKSDDPLFVDISDLNPIFDSPITLHLKKKIDKLQKILKLRTLKIKSLQKQNKRLKLKNKVLQDTNKALKQERLIMLEMESAIETKVEKMEPNESCSSNIHNLTS
ncbi:uncharacterized protein LOC121733208 [Aricia agestis]|uniref:uncharacterized protein LOC121733208 n=1 Tax=Aricia agestis TaxID=91739 RepID=UPI001C20435A|nr:uncharacterized protein LOC121733208 [Aricia agestis]